MAKQGTLLLGLEALWWLVTIIVLGAVLYPILSQVNDYPFTFQNVIFIVTFITITRHLFFLKHSFIAKQQILKIGLIFLSFPFIFFLIHQLNIFQTFIDENSMDEFMKDVSFESKPWLIKFIRSEMIFFGVGSVIAAILFPIRMLQSVWRTRNRNTV